MKKNKKNKEVEKFLEDAEEALNAHAKDVKVRVTTMIDADVLDELRRMAKKVGVGYQTLLNLKLREAILGEAIVDRNTIRSINEKLNKLEKKVENLSKRAQFKNEIIIGIDGFVYPSSLSFQTI